MAATDIQWWTCGDCGTDTETHADPPPHRVCPDCGWTAALPTPREVGDDR
jgi:rubrerythrin